jgi:hypothetical protein
VIESEGAGGCKTVGRGVPYTLQHMERLVKELELRVFGVRIASVRPSKVEIQRTREELYLITT